MKKLVLPLAIVAAAGLTACNQQAADAPANAAPAAAPVTLDSTEQRISYGIAFSLGMRMNQDPSVPLDRAAFMAGIQDALDGNPGKMTGTGRIVHHGRSIAYLDAELRQEDRLIATATSTVKLLRARGKET